MNVFSNRVTHGQLADPEYLRSVFESKHPGMMGRRGTLAYDFTAERWLEDNGYAPLYDDTEAWEHEAGRR